VVADRAVRLVGRRRLLIATAASVAPVPAALALTSSPVAIVLAFVLVGSTGMIWNVITVSLRQAITPDHLLGRMNSAYRLLAWGTMPAGAALGGLAAELIGPRGVFVVLAVVSPLLVIPMLRLTDEDLDAAEAAAAQPPGQVPFTSAR
jgi:MFS family permease